VNAPPVKQNWIDRALDIHRFHIQQLKDEPKWTVERTANALNRSTGSVSEDLLLTNWLRTHEKQLRRCSSRRDALAWIRVRQREMRIEEVDI